MKKSKMEKAKIKDILQKSFHGPAWHGPSVMEVLTALTPDTVTQKISNAHTIIELVLHMAAWRDFVAKRLLGNNNFEVSEEANFPKETDWTSAMAALQQSQKDLMSAIDQFPDKKLQDTVPTRKYDFYTMLHGIIQHDIYHTGQIVIIKKLKRD
jgi:uncharacterized damage-inducible protein DinB